jgi:hypothetical protein
MGGCEGVYICQMLLGWPSRPRQAGSLHGGLDRSIFQERDMQLLEASRESGALLPRIAKLVSSPLFVLCTCNWALASTTLACTHSRR